jgi:cobalamin biosynthesis Mg chelatase CobN
MQGAPRRQARSSARSFFLLPSVLALLALALVPAGAFAANSGETVYETELPSVTSEPGTSGTEKTPTHHKSQNNAKAEGSAAKESSGGSEGESEEGSSEGGHKKKEGSSEEKKEEGHPGTSGGGDGGNKPNGGAGKSGGSEGNSVGEQKNLGNTQPGKNVAHSSSGGGSSPVVPILIAVVVLAAISIGVVLYRQRKSDQGGSDGRASSPSAS